MGLAFSRLDRGSWLSGLFWLRLCAQDGHGAALQRRTAVPQAIAAARLGIGSIEEALPLLSLFEWGQRKRNRFVMGIHQQQNGVAYHRFPTLVRSPMRSPGPPHPQATGIAGIPGVLGHLLAGGVKPRDVQDAFAANGTAQEKFAALKDRLGAAGSAARCGQNRQRLLLLVGQLPVEPGELVILAIGVVVALLRVP